MRRDFETECELRRLDDELRRIEVEQPYISSRELAILYGQGHGDVLRNIEKAKNSSKDGEWIDKNFYVESTYKDKNNRDRRQVLISRQGVIDIPSPSYHIATRGRLFDEYIRIKTSFGSSITENGNFLSYLSKKNKLKGLEEKNQEYLTNITHSKRMLVDRQKYLNHMEIIIKTTKKDMDCVRILRKDQESGVQKNLAEIKQIRAELKEIEKNNAFKGDENG